jgi:DNA-binding response OmpR family regulator
MRLLLVEPHNLLARAIKMGLGEEGFAVDVVGETEKADARLRENRYDVILLDMLAGNAMHTVRRWRRCGLRAPVLMLTASANDMDRQAELNSDWFDMLVKPFDLEELLLRVSRLAPKEVTPEKSIRG